MQILTLFPEYEEPSLPPIPAYTYVGIQRALYRNEVFATQLLVNLGSDTKALVFYDKDEPVQILYLPEVIRRVWT